MLSLCSFSVRAIFEIALPFGSCFNEMLIPDNGLIYIFDGKNDIFVDKLDLFI